ncbi:hypothetical protein Lal_00037553 [Lupinus albus]|nr:hypothetical protein Lal_00037553 [Lupinus albus]
MTMQNMHSSKKPELNSKTRVFNSESNHPDGADGYFTEHIAVTNSDKLPSQLCLTQGMNKYVLVENENTTRETHANQPSSSVAQQPFSIPLPFPPKIIPTKKMGNMEELDKDLLDTFRKVEVNIPLLDAIKQIPRYAKFLKELCTHKRNFCIDEFLNIDIDIDVPCTSLYTCHACIDSELCDSCIDEFLNIVVDSPVTHSHCTNPNDAGIRQQSDLFVQVQAATKPRFATFFPSVLQAPDWRPPFDLECDIAVYALGIVLASYEFDFLPP